MNPILVDQVTDGQGRVLYHSRITALNKAIRPPTAVVLRELMQETIKSGTCKKTFRGHEKDPVLSRLVMGGKTGTINSHDHAGRRFDWFVGFAQEKGGMENLVISAFVAHEKYIGPKANYYGRLIMKDHFARYFDRQDRKQLTRANQPASEVRD
jgi:membrane peptidoglycan carboxypeptidase